MGVVRAMKKSPHIPPNVRISTRDARFAEPVVMVSGTFATVNVRIVSPLPLKNRITITEENANSTGI
jgi:hypothetical protein